MEGRTVCIDYGTESREREEDSTYIQRIFGISPGMPVPPFATIATYLFHHQIFNNGYCIYSI